MEQAPLLIYPNEWIRQKTLQFCQIAYRNMTDAEIFCRIRTPFKSYLQNRVLLMSHTDQFEDFIIPPISRIIVDLSDTYINEDFPYTPHDATAKLIINKTLNELRLPDFSEHSFNKYMEYVSSLKAIKNVSPWRVEITTNPAVDPTQVEKQPNRILACQPQYIRKTELEEYVDLVYYPQKVPLVKGYMENNHGMNSINPFLNYGATKWQQAYKQQWLCKALNLYATSNDYMPGRYKYTIQHRWEDWKPYGNLVVTLYNHKAPVSSIATTKDSGLMATGSSDGTCLIWSPQEMERDIDLNPINKIYIKNKIRTLQFVEDENTVLLGTDRGALYFAKIEQSSPEQIYKKVTTTQEGGLVSACPLKCDPRQNSVIYVTQRGIIHIHDLRAKRDVTQFSMDCQRGILTCACLGNDDYSLLVGTLGGYIGIYDIRFNLMSSLRKYTCSTPLSDICTYSPTDALSSPLVFAAPSTPTPHLDLFNLNTEVTEWSFVAGPPPTNPTEKIKKQLEIMEMHYTDLDLVILKRLVKHLPLEEESLLEDKLMVCGWANVYKKAKGLYHGDSRITRILCPRLSQEGASAPFMLAGGADRVVRYLYFGELDEKAMSKKSLIVNSPDDRTCEYVIDQTEPHVLREKPVPESKKDATRPGGGNGMFEIRSGEKFKLANPSHSDAILDMTLLDLSVDTFLVTCSRDNTVKIWT